MPGLTYRIRKDNGREIIVHVNRLKENKVAKPPSPLTEVRSQIDDTPIRSRNIFKEQGSGTNEIQDVQETARNAQYWLRSRTVRTNEQAMQEIINEELASGTESEAENENTDSDDVWEPSTNRKLTEKNRSYGRNKEKDRVDNDDSDDKLGNAKEALKETEIENTRTGSTNR